jgi:hypothetical protein
VDYQNGYNGGQVAQSYDDSQLVSRGNKRVTFYQMTDSYDNSQAATSSDDRKLRVGSFDTGANDLYSSDYANNRTDCGNDFGGFGRFGGRNCGRFGGNGRFGGGC